MARRPKRLWRGNRRGVLNQVKRALLRLESDRDREEAKADAGLTPLYLAAPGHATWTKVDELLTLIGQALSAVG